jgi:protein-disulfide isomerase
MTRVCRAALGTLMAAALLAAPSCKSNKTAGPSPSPAADQVVAEVDGQRITLAELDHKLVERMPQERIFEMRRQVLDEMVAERLLEKEARARGVTAEQLTKTEIEAKAQAVTEGDVQELFMRSGLAARGATLEQYRPRIEQSLRAQRTADRRAAFSEELRAKAKVNVILQEPRVQITIPADAPLLGPPTAPITLVEFLDYQCPYCHKVQGVVEQVMRQFPGKVRFVHRDFPLDEIHPDAMRAARAARCAGEQGKFWQYHKRLLTDPGHDDQNLRMKAAAEGLNEAKFQACLASDRYDAAIQQATAQGRELGVSGTPTFFINGRRLVGIRSAEDFVKVIEEELKRVG